MKLTYLFSTFVLLVSGLVIWSCSQEETDDVMTVYRYSPEEIATLRSMAEEYGIPNVKFITESESELPTMDEMKETMAQFYANLYRDYYAGRTMNYEIIRLEPGYQMWNRYLSTTVQFRQLEGMMRDGMAVNNNVEIPDPVHQIWE